MLGFLLFADWFRRLSAAAASRIILCYAFVDSLRLPLDNRFFTVVRDILSVKAHVCVCVFVMKSKLLYPFTYTSRWVWVNVAAFIRGEIRSEAAWQYCFLWRLDDAFRNVVLTGKWMGFLKTKNDEMYVRACIVYLCVCVSTVFCSRFCSVKRWFGFISFFLHQQIYFIVFLSFTFKI